MGVDPVSLGDKAASLATSAGAEVVAGAVVAFKLAQYAVHEYKEKKVLAQITYILGLYEKHLSALKARKLGDEDPVALPPPYSIPKGKQSPHYESVQASQAILKNIINKTPYFNNSKTDEFVTQVLNAMKIIEAYYEWRLEQPWYVRWFSSKTENDQTSQVLCYTLLMLSEHCVSFQGAKDEIYYVRQLSAFLLEFICQNEKKSKKFDPKQRKTTARYNKLIEAYKCLKNAGKILEKNERHREPDELICDLATQAKRYTSELIKLYIRFLIPNKLWGKIDSATLENIEAGLVKPEEKYKVLFWTSDPAITLPPLILTEWIRDVTRSYLKVTSPQTYGKERGENLILEMPDYFEPLEDKIKRIHEKYKLQKESTHNRGAFAGIHTYFVEKQEISACKKQYKKNQEDFKELKKFFDNSPLFLLLLNNFDAEESKLSEEKRKALFYHRCVEVMLNMIKVMATETDILAHDIELQRFFKAEGENILHKQSIQRTHIFTILDRLNGILLRQYDHSINDCSDLNERAVANSPDDNVMQMLESLANNLLGAKSYMLKASNDVVMLNTPLEIKGDDKPHIDCQHMKFLEPFCDIATRNGIHTGFACKHHQPKTTPETERPTLALDTHNTDEGQQIEGRPNPRPTLVISSTTTDIEPDGLLTPSPPDSPQAKEEKHAKLPAVDLDTYLEAISDQLTKINDASESEYNIYSGFYRDLEELKAKAEALAPERKYKAKVIHDVTLKLAQATFIFLSLPDKTKRDAGFNAYSRKVHPLLKNLTLDDHTSGFGKLGSVFTNMYHYVEDGNERHNFRFFNTHSRRIANHFEADLEQANEMINGLA